MEMDKSAQTLHILLVEDNEHDRLAFYRALEKSRIKCEIITHERAEDAIKRISADESSLDLVVIDHGLPGMSGLNLCKALIKGKTSLPLVILSGQKKMQLAVEALKAGVNDYIIKDSGEYLNLLPIVLPEVVKKHEDRLSRKLAEEELKKHRDHLDELVKQRTFELAETNKKLRKEIKERRQTEEKLRKLSSEMLIVEERERRLIAMDLHDGIGQDLACAKIKLSMLRKSDLHLEFDNDLRELYELIGKTIQDTRSLTYELSPPVLHQFGLGVAIEWLTGEMTRKYNIQIEFTDDNQLKPLDESSNVILFRAARELLYNIVKHARTKTAKVSLARENDFMRIEISDSGVGFKTSKILNNNYNTGFGLFSIKERMEHLNGSFKVESKPNRGTRFALVAPLKQGESNGKRKNIDCRR